MMKKDMLKLEVLLRVPGLILLGIILFTQTAHCQNWVEERTYVSEGAVIPRIDGLLTGHIKGNFGSFTWFQIQQGYAEAYGGATYSPKSWMQLALGVGIEEDKHPARIGSYIWMGKGPVSVLAVFEDGGSGFWYKVEATYQTKSKFAVGFLSERYHGTGPKMEFSVPRTALKLWCAPLIENGSVKPVLGVRWSL
jgi:hypothetical protein